MGENAVFAYSDGNIGWRGRFGVRSLEIATRVGRGQGSFQISSNAYFVLNYCLSAEDNILSAMYL